MDEAWFVSLYLDSGVCLRVCSSEHACKTAYDAWVDHKHAEFKDEGVLIEVEGYDESLKREFMKVAVLAESLVSVVTGKY